MESFKYAHLLEVDGLFDDTGELGFVDFWKFEVHMRPSITEATRANLNRIVVTFLVEAIFSLMTWTTGSTKGEGLEGRRTYHRTSRLGSDYYCSLDMAPKMTTSYLFRQLKQPSTRLPRHSTFQDHFFKPCNEVLWHIIQHKWGRIAAQGCHCQVCSLPMLTPI